MTVTPLAPGTVTATVGGNGVQLLDLEGSNVRVTQDRSTTRLEGTVAKLSAAAAQALNQTFGVSLFQQGFRSSFEMSMLGSAMASTTAAFTSLAGALPVERTWSRSWAC